MALSSKTSVCRVSDAFALEDGVDDRGTSWVRGMKRRERSGIGGEQHQFPVRTL